MPECLINDPVFSMTPQLKLQHLLTILTPSPEAALFSLYDKKGILGEGEGSFELPSIVTRLRTQKPEQFAEDIRDNTVDILIDIVKDIQASGVDFNTTFTPASQRNLLQIMAQTSNYPLLLQRLIEELGLDPNIKDRNNNTLLHLAATSQKNPACFDVLKRCLCNKTKESPKTILNGRNKQNETPMYLAFLEKNDALFNHLCLSNAPIGSDTAIEELLQICVNYGSDRGFQTLRLLLDNQILFSADDVHSPKTHIAQSALIHAITDRNEDIAVLLINHYIELYNEASIYCPHDPKTQEILQRQSIDFLNSTSFRENPLHTAIQMSALRAVQALVSNPTLIDFSIAFENMNYLQHAKKIGHPEILASIQAVIATLPRMAFPEIQALCEKVISNDSSSSMAIIAHNGGDKTQALALLGNICQDLADRGLTEDQIKGMATDGKTKRFVEQALAIPGLRSEQASTLIVRQMRGDLFFAQQLALESGGVLTEYDSDPRATQRECIYVLSDEALLQGKRVSSVTFNFRTMLFTTYNSLNGEPLDKDEANLYLNHTAACLIDLQNEVALKAIMKVYSDYGFSSIVNGYTLLQRAILTGNPRLSEPFLSVIKLGKCSLLNMHHYASPEALKRLMPGKIPHHFRGKDGYVLFGTGIYYVNKNLDLFPIETYASDKALFSASTDQLEEADESTIKLFQERDGHPPAPYKMLETNPDDILTKAYTEALSNTGQTALQLLLTHPALEGNIDAKRSILKQLIDARAKIGVDTEALIAEDVRLNDLYRQIRRLKEDLAYSVKQGETSSIMRLTRFSAVIQLPLKGEETALDLAIIKKKDYKMAAELGRLGATLSPRSREFLLQIKKTPDRYEEYRPILIQFASELTDSPYDYEKIAEWVYECGDINAINETTGETALHTAVRKQQVDITELLLEKGANPLTYNSKGETVYTVALQLGAFTTSLSILIAQVATLSETKDQKGNHLLHLAVSASHFEAAILILQERRFLLELNETNNEGQTALDLARANGDNRLASLIERKVAIPLKSSYGHGRFYPKTTAHESTGKGAELVVYTPSA